MQSEVHNISISIRKAYLEICHIFRSGVMSKFMPDISGISITLPNGV